MQQNQIEGFIKVFDTLKLYQRITPKKLGVNQSDIKERLIEELYVDLIPNNGILNKLLSSETFVLLGRRGTGKSTLFARAQFEIIKQKKDISAYVNAKSVMDDVTFQNLSLNIPDIEGLLEDIQIQRLLLVKKFIKDIFESIEIELKKEEQNLFEKVTNKFRDNKIEALLQSIKQKIDNPQLLDINGIITNSVTSEESSSNSKNVERGADFSSNINKLKEGLTKIYSKSKKSEEISRRTENEQTNIFAKLFNIGEILDELKSLLKIIKRSKLYIFIDDFSEISQSDMELFYQTILNPIYNTAKDEIILKIAAYPGRITYGDLEPGKYGSIQIDAFELYGGNIVELEKKSTDFIKRLVENRVKYFCNTTPETFFNVSEIEMKEYYTLLFEASMNIPRKLGHILSVCFDNAISYKRKINKNDILNAAETIYTRVTKTYFDKEHVSKGVFDEKIDIYTQQRLIEDICARSLDLKVFLPKSDNLHFKSLDYAHSSHFQVKPELEAFLDSLEFNGLVHKVSMIAPKSTKGQIANKDLTIYSIDLGLCEFKKILYGRPNRTSQYSKYYQQRTFNYTSLIMDSLSNIKKIICSNPDCKAEYDITDYEEISKYGMMCRSCYKQTCEIVFDEQFITIVKENLQKAYYETSELDVLQTIHIYNSGSLNKNAYASEIGEELDISYQAVGRIASRLITHKLVDKKPDLKGRNHYIITEKGKKVLKELE